MGQQEGKMGTVPKRGRIKKKKKVYEDLSLYLTANYRNTCYTSSVAGVFKWFTITERVLVVQEEHDLILMKPCQIGFI